MTLKAVLVGGWIAGTLDIGAACLINGVGPSLICQAIARGVLGLRSYELGMMSAALGLGLQWLMSMLIAALYVTACRWLPDLRRHWLASGLAYGVPVFIFMNYVVMPLSAIHHVAHFTPRTGIGNFVTMLGFGVLIAYFARDVRKTPGPGSARSPA